jgi:hypothetical protein
MTKERKISIRQEIYQVNETIKSCGNVLKRLLTELDEDTPAPKQSKLEAKVEQIRLSGGYKKRKK